MKYRRRPTIVDAEQWQPGKDIPGVQTDIDLGAFVVTVHRQRVYLQPGDYVVQEPDGKHYYPVQDEIFEATYEKEI